MLGFYVPMAYLRWTASSTSATSARRRRSARSARRDRTGAGQAGG